MMFPGFVLKKHLQAQKVKLESYVRYEQALGQFLVSRDF